MSEYETPIDNKKKPEVDEIYLQIWVQQQESIRHRWTVISFFFTISFAVFGFSIQDSDSFLTGNIQRLVAVCLYWFSFLMYIRHATWSKFLGEYLEELESSTNTSILLQRKWNNFNTRNTRKWITTKRLLLYFGFIYTSAVFILWYIGL